MHRLFSSFLTILTRSYSIFVTIMRNIELSRGEATDLASLWGKAVKEYERSANIKTSHMNNHSAQQVAQNLSQIMDASEEKTKLFESHRHRKDKVSKARSSVGKHLEGMQKCLGGISMVGGAAAVFPPAMPVTIIFAACDRVLGAFLSVRDEMDKIEQFLALSNRFFERLSIIESSKCSDGPLAQAIVRVFSAQLSVYAVVEEVVVRKNGRISEFCAAVDLVRLVLITLRDVLRSSLGASESQAVWILRADGIFYRRA
jgi:hypothetical protein